MLHNSLSAGPRFAIFRPASFFQSRRQWAPTKVPLGLEIDLKCTAVNNLVDRIVEITRVSSRNRARFLFTPIFR